MEDRHTKIAELEPVPVEAEDSGVVHIPVVEEGNEDAEEKGANPTPISGDLLLRVRIAPQKPFVLKGHDIEVEVPITPWDAVLGASVAVPTVEGRAKLRIPPGTQTGRRFRLKGKGLPKRRGDTLRRQW